MSLCIIIIFLLLVEGRAEPPSDKVVGDRRNPIMNRDAVYIANNTRFERICTIKGGDDGVPELKFIGDDGLAILPQPPRRKITILTDRANKIVTGTFVLNPALVEDNTIKKVTCRNMKAGISTQFILNVIADASIPVIEINNGNDTANVTKGDTVKLTCSLSAKIGTFVKEYSVAWAVDSLKTVKCPSKRAKKTLLPDVNADWGPDIKKDDVLTSVLTINKAVRRYERRFFCVACMKLGESSSFDTVKKYYDSIDVKVLMEDSGETDFKTEIERYIGEEVEFDCEGKGLPPPTLTWSKKKREESEVSLPFDDITDVDVRYSFDTSEITDKDDGEKSAENSVFKIVNITLADRSQYICRAYFWDRNVTRTFTLRVRDPWGVWIPVIGMVAEAFLLLVIIVTCDHYKQRSTFLKEKKERKAAKKRGDIPDGDDEIEPLVGAKATSNNEVLT